MGGQSFRCPLCPVDDPFWCLKVYQMRDHLRDKHEIHRANLNCFGPVVEILSSEPVPKPPS